jgi:hypothetical protein
VATKGKGQPVNRVPVTSLDNLALRLSTDKDFKMKFADDPIKTLSDVIEEAQPYKFTTDRWIYRVTVAALSVIAVAALIAISILAGMNPSASAPEGLVALGSAAVGGLVGMLVPSHLR